MTDSLVFTSSASISVQPQTDRTVAEYFAGIGLVRLGLEQAGWHVSYANDISARKYVMYEQAFPHAAGDYHVEDIFSLDALAIPETTLATCSFPCTDLSLAGKQNGIHGAQSSAFWGFIHVLREQGKRAPQVVLLENVPGWLNSNGGDDFRQTVQSLNALGYTADVFTLDARRFVPQSRPRIFLIGRRKTISTTTLDPFLRRNTSLKNQALETAVSRNADLAWNWLNIPEPPPLLQAGLSDLVEDMPDHDLRWWTRDQVTRHLEMMKAEHRSYVLKLASSFLWSYRTMFRRMRSGIQRAEVRKDDLAGCLRTASGGSARQFILKLGNGQIMMRHMTGREYARLQGVPDKYPIIVSDREAQNGFGDAVCVPLITWIAANVLPQTLL